MNIPRPVLALFPLCAFALLLAATRAEGAAPDGAPGEVPANLPVRLATLEWPPYVGSGLPDQGYAAVVVRAVFEEQGLPVQIDFYPWTRGLYLVASGEVDGLMPAYLQPSRFDRFQFSDPFPGGPLVMYKRRGDDLAFAADPGVDPEAALRGLSGKRVGVVRGYLNTPELDAADYLDREEVNDDAAVLRELVDGQVDLAVIDLRVAEYLIRNHYPDYAELIEPMFPVLRDFPLHVAFSRKSRRTEAIVTAFNRGLEAMRADGRLEALHQHYIVHPGAVDQQSEHVRAEAAATEFATRLRQTLMSAMKSGGPLAAVDVCHQDAPRIAAEVGSAHNVALGRVGVRLRNPANAGPAWAADALRDFQRRVADGEPAGDMRYAALAPDGSSYRTALGLQTEGPCLICHGPSVSAELTERIRSRYPDDEATGFAAGSLRGLLWVEAPVKTPGSSGESAKH